MVTAKESQTCQQVSARNSTNLDQMALLQSEQNYSLPSRTPSTFAANVTFPGQPTYALRGLNTDQQIAAGGFSKLPPPPYWDISYPTGNPYLKDSQCASPHGLGVTDKPVDASCAPQKRFLIFDQSGNQTRLFFGPPFSPQNPTVASKTPASANGLCEKVSARVDQQFFVKPVVEEKWEENDSTDGEAEMLEDSDEIDALLYSDSDDEIDDDSDGENDEVTSMKHTPFSIEEGYDRDKLLDELIEEVASSDGSPKRQRLLDGRYKQSSLVSFESPVKRASSSSYEDDVESICAAPINSYDDIDSSKREKKVKIREALKIMETIIPGLKSKNPLSIIDKAIVYLESMKTEAEALGLSYPETESATFP